MRQLKFYSFPDSCELDPNLLREVAKTVAPKLSELHLCNQKLQQQPMQALFVFLG